MPCGKGAADETKQQNKRGPQINTKICKEEATKPRLLKDMILALYSQLLAPAHAYQVLLLKKGD